MDKLGTVFNLARQLGLNHAVIPHEVGEFPVVVNPRLRTAFGRYCRKGRRNPLTREIAWSNQRVEINAAILRDLDCLRDTVGHEIAHAMEPDDGHGYRWANAARALGVRAERCATAVEAARVGITRSAAKKPIGTCAQCGEIIKGRRALARDMRYRHRGCGGEIERI